MSTLAFVLIVLILPPPTPHDFADSDGDVPIKTLCQPHGNPEWGRLWVGHYETTAVGSEVQGTIYINDCKTGPNRLGRIKRQAVIRHERAHSLGWDHFEGAPETNPAYYP